MTLILAFFLTWMHAAHPLHVSVTNLEMDLNKQLILITHKLYSDDFSLLFYHVYEKNIKFSGGDLTENELALVSDYMNTAFFLEMENKRLPMVFTGKEQDDESVWLHYTCKLPEGQPGKLTLTNNLLLALFDDQTNLVIISAGQAQKGYTFTADKWKHDIDPGLLQGFGHPVNQKIY